MRPTADELKEMGFGNARERSLVSAYAEIERLRAALTAIHEVGEAEDDYVSPVAAKCLSIARKALFGPDQQSQDKSDA